MPPSQSLLAELRVLEARRASGGLTPSEERRLGELRAATGSPAPARTGGFDVNAAAAALRESPRLAGPGQDVGAVGPSTPPLAPELSEPGEVAAAAERAPLPGLDAGPPAGYDLEPPPPAAPDAPPSEEGYDAVPAFDAAGRDAVVGEVPEDWSSWQEPGEAAPGSEAPAEAAPAAAPEAGEGQAQGEGQWDPALAAQWDAYARAQGWDPGAPWDPDAVARQWDGFLRSLGYDPAAAPAGEAAPAFDATAPAEAAPSWDAGAPAEAAPSWDAGASPAIDPTQHWDVSATPPAAPAAEAGGTQVWPLGATAAPSAAAPAEQTAWGLADGLGLPLAPGPAVLGRRESETDTWNLSGPAEASGAPGLQTTVPDEGDPGATSAWTLSLGGGVRPMAPPAAPEGPEPMVLDDLQLESSGSFEFGKPRPQLEVQEPPAEPPAAAWIPPLDLEALAPPGAAAPAAPEPVEVADDQILEVGGEVTELGEAQPAPAFAEPVLPPLVLEDADELPVVEAVEVAEEAVPISVVAPPPDVAATLPAALVPPPPPAPEPAPAPVAPPPPAVAAVPLATIPLVSVRPAPPAPEVPAVPVASHFPPAPPQTPLPQPMPPWSELAAEPLSLPPEPPEPAQAPEAEPVPLETLTIEEEVPLPPEPADARVLSGLHRVVLHTVEGQVMRGLLQDPDLMAGSLALAAQPGAEPEAISTQKVRAIFFMLSPGERAPTPGGARVRVTFRDGRQVAGFSPDYDPEAVGFFMIPADSRTNTARIWVYKSAVRQVSVS